MPSFSMYFCICKPPVCNSGGILEGAKSRETAQSTLLFQLLLNFQNCIPNLLHIFMLPSQLITLPDSPLRQSQVLLFSSSSSPEVGVIERVRPRKEATSEPRVQRTCAQNLQWTEHAWIRVEKSSIISTHLNRWRCALCIRVFQKWHLSKKKLPSQYNPFQGLYV